MSPFFVAVVADVVWGGYWSIMFFTGLCYIPGVLLIAVCSIPFSQGRTDFPLEQLRIGTHILFPMGFGAAKTLYGVYAAKQYDPIHQSDQLEKFFVIFTGVEFIGSFLGAMISIVLADRLRAPEPGIIIAEFINLGAVVLGLLIFIVASRRYVNGKLMRKTYGQMFRSLVEAVLCFGGNGFKGCGAPGFAKTKESEGGRIPDNYVDGMKQIILLIPIFLLVVPTNIAFTQIIVVNITMTSNMQGFGAFKGPLLVSFGLLFIGVWAFFMKKFLAPYLERKNIKLSTANRFALGSFFIACAYAIAAIIESQIKRAYLEDGSKISIFWGLFGTFIGGGVAFLFAAMNEIAFTIAPPELKMLGTAIMLFLTQGIPNLIGSILFGACEPWFLDSEGKKIRTIEQFVDGNSTNFTYLMLGLSLSNVLIMMIPPVKNWISRVEDRSICNNRARTQNTTTGVGDKAKDEELAKSVGDEDVGDIESDV